jgi:transposase-like protein
MNEPKFSQKQMHELQNNPNVVKCSNKSITYAKDFKIEAVRKYDEDGMTPVMIFLEARFNLDVIGKSTPKNCLGDWRRVFKLKGATGLNTEMRGRSPNGGRPRLKGLTDAEKIKRLKIEVAYLKEENSFLAKLRAKRTE